MAKRKKRFTKVSKPFKATKPTVTTNLDLLATAASASNASIPSDSEKGTDEREVFRKDDECAVINPILGATLEDLEISDRATNVVANNRKSLLTRLKAIKGMPIVEIDVRTLCIFCTSNGLMGYRKKTKLVICDAIVETKESREYKRLQKEAKENDNKKKRISEEKCCYG